jgi:sugar phosphate isomerase/epimerase
MLDVAISQITTPRWELSRELDRLVAHGFSSLAVWRPKLSDMGPAAAAAALRAAGVRPSSLHGAGGFTGSDGRSFAESLADAVEAVEAAATLAAASPAPPVVVLHSGCRAGHTRSHARRLLLDALTILTPTARREGVTLAVQPLRAAVAAGCSFLATLDEALDVVEACADPAVGLALDLWHFSDDPRATLLLPRLAAATVLVQAADRSGPPTAAMDRLPAGHGTLPLESLATGLVTHGYRGVMEFDPVGEAVEVIGYDGVLRETRLVADEWAVRHDAIAAESAAIRSEVERTTMAPWPAHFRLAVGGGSRRSQASSQTLSRG